MSNEITAYFKGRAGVSESLYQYDYGMVLNLDGIELPSSFECYFDTTGSDEAIPAIGTDSRVAIPNDCLSRPGDVTLHIPLHSGVNDSQVEYVVKFRVIGRARPVDGGTPEQQTAIEQALALLQNPITNIEQIVNEALDFTGDTFDEMQAKLDADQTEFEDEMQAKQTEFESEINSDFEQLNSQFNNLATNVKANSVNTLWTGTLKAKNDSATLSESVANFDYIDIYTGSTDNRCVRKKVSDLSSVVRIQGQNLYDMSGGYGLAESEIHLSISGTTATIVKTINFSWNGAADQAANSSADVYDVECPIIRIDGVKIGSHESAELTDIRVGADGITDTTAGASVRRQFSSLKSDLNRATSELEGKVDGVKLANLFDFRNITAGYYVGANGLIELSGWNASDFIPVESGETYSATFVSNARFYDDSFNSTGSILASPFTVPDGVSYARFSITDAELAGFMLVKGDTLPSAYIRYGAVLGMNSFTDDVIKELKMAMGVGSLNLVREHLDNPFIRTQIKLVGDSITAGQGGTGYDASGTSGEAIGGTANAYTNVLTAICFSNMLYHYIDDMYNKMVEVDIKDNNIAKPYIGRSSAISNHTYNNGTVEMTIPALVENNTIDDRDFVSFNFFGDAFKVYTKNASNKGIFEIYVDDVLIDTVDCYSANENGRVEHSYTGLTSTQHTVVLRTTASKNIDSTLNQIIISGIAITKVAVVKPWGISGATSAAAENTSGRYTTDDDFVILQYGTNDRHMFFAADATMQNLISAGNIIKETYDAIPIFMCPPPCDESYESDTPTPRYYHMWDVHDAVCKVGDYYNMPIVDNYRAFIDYLDAHTDLTLNDLLADGLHPNDLGYKVIFDNIMDSLGFARFPAYMEWPNQQM